MRDTFPLTVQFVCPLNAVSWQGRTNKGVFDYTTEINIVTMLLLLLYALSSDNLFAAGYSLFTSILSITRNLGILFRHFLLAIPCLAISAYINCYEN